MSDDVFNDDDFDEADPTHPRFRERLAEVEDQTLRVRNRKLMALGILVLLIVLAGAATQSPLMDVDEVRIVGAERTSPDVLRFIAGVDLGAPILGLDTDAVETRLASLPAVASVTATKSWGGVVTVEIDERVPIARINSLDGVLLVASDGMVLELITAAPVEDADGDPSTGGEANNADPDPELLPLPELPPDVIDLTEISGAMFASEPGRQVPTVLDDAVLVATALPADIRSITDQVEITVDSLVLRVVGSGSISIGDARDLEAKFEAVRAFLAQVDLSCLETLDVRAPTVPVIVRDSSC